MSNSLEQEASLRFFAQASRNETNYEKRNPITQEGIRDKEIGMPLEGNPRGLAKGTYSKKAQGSFKLAYDARELQNISPTKRAECQPIIRNPITLDGEPIIEQSKPEKAQKYSKFNTSNIFNKKNTEISEPRKVKQ